MLLQRWIRFGVLSSALVLFPSQAVFAGGAQWRPLLPAAPDPQRGGAVAMPSIDARQQQFRPAYPVMRPPMPVAPRHAPPPPRWAMPTPRSGAPAFTRQYGWRPAQSRWMARNEAAQPRQVRQVRHVTNPRQMRAPLPPPASRNHWRPVPVEMQRSMPRGYVAANHWRPVPPRHLNQRMTARPGQPVYRPVQVRAPYVPAAPRMPRPVQQAGYPGYALYPFPPRFAGYPGAFHPPYMPYPAHHLPVRFPAQAAVAPWMPYSGRDWPHMPAQHLGRPAYGMTGRDGPVGYAGSRSTRVDGLPLAGCPGC
jgi:hypothetical protein